MKLTFKDLKQQKFVIEAEPSETIADVKAKISAEKGTGWEPAQQKLIYSGKILQDDKTVESYNIEEKGFIVCMVSKPKATAASSSKAAPSTPAPATVRTPAAPAPAASSTTSNAPATPTPAPAAPRPFQLDDPSALVMGSEREAAIAQIESMGFSRAETEQALRDAHGNPQRAIEYLLDPDSRPAPQPAQAPAANTASPSPTPAAPATGNAGLENLFEAAAAAHGGRGGTTGTEAPTGQGAGQGTGGAAAGGTNLDFLRNSPQFQQLRQLVQQQPQMLEPILQQVAAGNQDLVRLIGENPEQFLQLLAEDADEDTALPPGAQTISVTEAEHQAIDRLVDLGFTRDEAIQAYFACDKNEELAAQFLFSEQDREAFGNR